MGDSWLIGYSFSHHLLFSALPLRKSCEIRLEEFRYRDPSSGSSTTRKAISCLRKAAPTMRGGAYHKDYSRLREGDNWD
ncbi:hypothetical protein BHM03_00023963 [Ensete ventricosum]|uniref:Uncharacterized protein n=1 Tax=Ensete ventricosum TaxID=4639 RepID=A0A445MGL9_ENSVE|nr:hypothetical protein BHM03_00023963 [Ensete ventricosum]